MARYAVVDDASLVVNVILWDGNTATWPPPPGMTMVEDPDGMAGPGYTYADGVFVPPPVPAEPDDVPAA
jgi:hypothetical protein